MDDLIARFRNDEDGAVTVDWVVLTAAVVALAGTIGWSVHAATRDTGQQIGQHMEDIANR